MWFSGCYFSDVVMWFFHRKNISCSFVDGGFEEFRNLGFRGIRGAEGIEEIEGIEVFLKEKPFREVSCNFVDYRIPRRAAPPCGFGGLEGQRE